MINSADECLRDIIGDVYKSRLFVLSRTILIDVFSSEDSEGSSRSSQCYAVRLIRSIGEQSGRTTCRLGSTGLQAMPSEGRHSWHSRAHPPPLSGWQRRASPLSVRTTGRA